MDDQRDAAAATAEILRLASRIHFQLGPAAQEWLGAGDHSAGDAAIMRNLADLGPQTVPELAAMRPTSRQFIQGLVDGLAARGLVTLIDNPQHRRSRLVALTPKGRARQKALQQKWRVAMRRLGFGMDAKALALCAETLTTLLAKIKRD